MKMKVVPFVLSLCVLLAILDNMSAEAGFGLTKLEKMEKKAKKFARCCKKLNCYLPDVCYPSIFNNKLCDCYRKNE